MMNNKDFAAFILTHGRPNKVLTYNTLKRQGYTGKIYIVIDNEDATAEEYKKRFGNKVIVFDKKAIAEKIDSGDNFNDRRAIIYARNASFDIAQMLGIKYFIQLDDDYNQFQYKFNDKNFYCNKGVKNLDGIFDAMLEFYKNIPAKSIATAQGGDFMGGGNSNFSKDIKIKRKCMNSFICTPERRFKFSGRINEDVNTYTSAGSRGDLFMTIPNVSLVQLQTQSNSGGMTELYLDSGTYVKSFYTIMYQPSSVKISTMGTVNKRIHHLISWKNTVPKILSTEYKK